MLALLALAGCAGAPGPDAFITGSVISRERLYIPPDAVFDAALVDVTQVGEPPLVLGRQRIAPAGPLPYQLRIPYRQAGIQPHGRYEVRAALMEQGRLLLDTPGVHPVLLSPAFRHVDLIVARVPLLEATLAAAVPLRQTYWRLTEVVGTAALPPPAEGADAAHLVLARDSDRAAGSGGCNRFAARYTLDGGQLRFDTLLSGLRLCLKGGTSELAYLERLDAVRAYWQQGRSLELRDRAGKPLLRFVAEERGAPPLDDEEPPLQPS
ncbi:MAG: META domain-containing protein [Proteobacteria bacterium]|nr:META domain-containing protein [Pseudomonadota bacterium]